MITATLQEAKAKLNNLVTLAQKGICDWLSGFAKGAQQVPLLKASIRLGRCERKKSSGAAV